MVTAFPNIIVQTTFTLTVTDPCLSTNLVQPSTILSPMQTSVLVQVSPGGIPYFKPKQVDVIKDKVSEDHGDSTGTQYCGLR